MKVATWNVNSIRARKERVMAWVEAQSPDVLCMQEIKVCDEDFPCEDFRRLGYHVATYGQRTYNGVAIVSKHPLAEVERGFLDADEDFPEGEDPQSRLLFAKTGGLTVASVYVPNGQSVGSEKWRYKLRFLARLRKSLDKRFSPDHPILIGGDFNVAPDERDIPGPVEAWIEDVLFHPEARAALSHLAEFGLADAFRLHHTEGGKYSWWDYRQLAFPKNIGARIDHVFVSPAAAKHCVSAEIDRNARKGKLPSDHAPVIVTLDPAGFAGSA